MVQDKHGSLDLGHALRQKSGVPGCQNLPAAWLADAGVNAFFPALSPLERDRHARAMAAQQHPAAHGARGEAALRERTQAEDPTTPESAQPVVPFVRTAERNAAGATSGERERLRLARWPHGDREAALAPRRTALGPPSPTGQPVRPHTGHRIRLTLRRLPPRSQAHPRRLAGSLTGPQIAPTLAGPGQWRADHLNRGTIEVTTDPTTGWSVCPDRPHPLQRFQEVNVGTRRHRRCHEAPPSGSAGPDAVEKSL